MEQLEEKIDKIQEKIKSLLDNLNIINTRIENALKAIEKLEITENKLIYENANFIKEKRYNNVIIFLTFLLSFYLNNLIETRYLNNLFLPNFQIIFFKILSIISFFIPIISLVNYNLKTKAKRKKLALAKGKIHVIRNKIYGCELEIKNLKNDYRIYEDALEKYKIILQELKRELEIYQGKNNYLQITPSFLEFWLKKQKKKKTIEYAKVYKIKKK